MEGSMKKKGSRYIFYLSFKGKDREKSLFFEKMFFLCQKGRIFFVSDRERVFLCAFVFGSTTVFLFQEKKDSLFFLCVWVTPLQRKEGVESLRKDYSFLRIVRSEGSRILPSSKKKPSLPRCVRCQTLPSIRALGKYKPVIPGVPLIR